jgi:hypothetical protein
MWLMKKYGFYIHLDRVRGQECALVQIFPRRYKNQAEKKSERWVLQLPLLTALARTRPAIRLSSHSWASMHNADVRGPLELIRYVFSRSRQTLNTQFFPMLLGLPKIVLRLLIQPTFGRGIERNR